MREIKFRAWDNDQQRMFNVYGMGLDFITEDTLNGIDPGVNCFSGDDFKKLVPMQYTGLKDKNGNEIYEGDICRINFFDEGLKNGQVVFRIFHSGYYLEGTFGQWSMGTWEPSYIEIVGNIYQNPELLS